MFTANDLTGMRSTQEAHMMDTCAIQAVSTSVNSFRETVLTWPTETTSICGLDMRPGTERHGPDNTVLEYDATLRLPITTNPAVRDRIKITKRFDEVLSAPLIFEIVGPIQRGPSGIRILLKRVET